MDDGSDFTRLLHEASGGSRAAADSLFAVVYDSLRGLARQHLAGERPDHTLQPTALVNEAYLKLVRGQPLAINDRPHFFRLAAEAMRRILIDHAKARGRAKRDGKLTVRLLESCDLAVSADPDEMLTIDEAICRLEGIDPDAAGVVRMRFFLGLSLDEIAATNGVSVSTVRRDWAYARAYLFRELSADQP